MPTKTSNGTGGGLFSAGATWVGGVAPIDNDTVVIAAGDVVTYESDWSSAVTYPNGIAGMTITGTLKLSRTTSGYLKMKAATTIAGAGTFDCGASAGDAIPFAVKHTITGGAAWFIQGSGGLTMTVYAAEPAIPTAYLSGAEAIGQTELGLDRDITGDIWADGDTVQIDNINKIDNSEERTIAAGGRNAAHIDVTAGLTAAKLQGSLVHLTTRNVRLVGVGASGFVAQNFATSKLTIAGGEWTTSYRIFNACTGMAVSGGVFHGSAVVFRGCTSASITGGVFTGNSNPINVCTAFSVSGGIFSGFSNGISGNGHKVSGGTFIGGYYPFSDAFGIVVSGGSFSYCTYAFWTSFGIITGGTFSYCTNGLYNSAFEIKNATFSNNSTSDVALSSVKAFNTSFLSTENTGYTSLAREVYSESIDHDTTAGAFTAWTKGGITTNASATLPTGFTTYMTTALENAAIEGFWQKEVLVASGASATISMCLRKTAAMTYLPRCIVFNKASTDPFTGGAGLNTFTMTDSIDTWEYSTYTYTNSGTADVTLVIRFQGENATGNMLSAVGVEVLNVDLTTVLANLAIVDANIDIIKVLADDAVALIASK